MTYAKSGVDILKEEKAIKGMLSSIKSQRKGIGKPLGGHYAGMIEFGDYALVLCTDGVGSKVEIASELKKWDTMGIDCIAMNVNDAICVGAEPLAFVDYLAIEDPKLEITKEIGKGLNEGAKLSNISIIGGETASLPDVINGFDLAGTCLAYVKKNDIVTGEDIAPGDVIVGLWRAVASIPMDTPWHGKSSNMLTYFTQINSQMDCILERPSAMFFLRQRRFM